MEGLGSKKTKKVIKELLGKVTSNAAMLQETKKELCDIILQIANGWLEIKSGMKSQPLSLQEVFRKTGMLKCFPNGEGINSFSISKNHPSSGEGNFLAFHSLQGLLTLLSKRIFWKSYQIFWDQPFQDGVFGEILMLLEGIQIIQAALRVPPVLETLMKFSSNAS